MRTKSRCNIVVEEQGCHSKPHHASGGMFGPHLGDPILGDRGSNTLLVGKKYLCGIRDDPRSIAQYVGVTLCVAFFKQ